MQMNRFPDFPNLPILRSYNFRDLSKWWNSLKGDASMTSQWWTCAGVMLILLWAQAGSAQDALVGGDNAAVDAAAEDPAGEEFDNFGILGPSQGPSPEEQAEIDRLNAAGAQKAQAGDIDGALNDYESASRIAPNYVSYFEFGRLLREQGVSIRAITVLSTAIQQLRTLPEEDYLPAATSSYRELGLAYLDAQEFNSAIQTFQQGQLLPGQRTNAELIYNEGLAQKELALSQQFATAQSRAEDLQTALGRFDRAIEINPNYGDALFERGGTYFLLGQLDEAIDDLQQAVQLDGANPEWVAQYASASLRRALSEGQARNGDSVEIRSDLTIAIDHFSSFLQLIPEDRDAELELELDVSRESALISRSASYIALGDEQTGDASRQLYRRAIEDADAALVVVPALPDAHFQKGLAYRMMEELGPAVDAYTEALQLNPANTEGLLRRGIIFFRQGDYTLAKSDFVRAIRYSPDSNPRAHFWLGLVSSAMGDDVRAIYEFNLTIRYQPFYTLAYLNRGLTQMRLGRMERAIQDFTSVLSRDPRHEKARQLRAQAAEALAAMKG